MNLAAGTYYVTMEDGDGCLANDSVIITSPLPLMIGISSTDETAQDANDGTASADVSGGNPGYSFEWSNGDTTQTITNLAPGTYNVTVSDTLGCVIMGSANVSPFDCDITFEVFGDSLSCTNSNDGQAWVTNVTGTPPYSYEWSNGSVDSLITSITAGMYNVTVTDSLGCRHEAFIEITQPDSLHIEINVNDATCFEECDGQLTLNLSGGTPPYNVIGDTIGLCAGDYMLQITEGNDCITEVMITISEPDPIVLQDVEILNETNGEVNGAIDINITGATSFNWEGPNNFLSTSEDLTNLTEGCYDLSAFNDNGCRFDTTICIENTVGLDPVINHISIDVFPNPTYDLVNIHIQKESSSDTRILIYNATGEKVIEAGLGSASSISKQIDIHNLETGIYYVQVIDGNSFTGKRLMIL